MQKRPIFKKSDLRAVYPMDHRKETYIQEERPIYMQKGPIYKKRDLRAMYPMDRRKETYI